MRMRADPKAFYITDHYVNFPWMLLELSAIRREDLRELLEESWRSIAPQRPVAAYDAHGSFTVPSNARSASAPRKKL